MRFIIYIFIILNSFKSFADDKSVSIGIITANYIGAAVALNNIMVDHDLCDSDEQHKVKFNSKYISIEDYIKLYDKTLYEYGLILDSLTKEHFGHTGISIYEKVTKTRNEIFEKRKLEKLKDSQSFTFTCWKLYGDLKKSGEKYGSTIKLLESFYELKSKEDILLGADKTERHIQYYNLWNKVLLFENTCTCLRSTKRVFEGEEITNNSTEKCEAISLFFDYKDNNLYDGPKFLKILNWNINSISARRDNVSNISSEINYLYDLNTKTLIQTKSNKKINEHIVNEYHCKSNIEIL
jgi:hypothetical protein